MQRQYRSSRRSRTLLTQFIPDVTQNRVPIIQEIQKTVEIPRAQFMPVMTHDRCLRLKRPCSSHVFRTLRGSSMSQCVQRTMQVPQIPCLDPVEDVPVAILHQVLTIQTVHKMVEAPQSQHLDRAVDVVVMQRRTPVIQRVTTAPGIPCAVH